MLEGRKAQFIEELITLGYASKDAEKEAREKAKAKSDALLIDYKYFKRWKYEMEPFVKNDGTIMTEKERIEAWDEARKQN